MSRTSDLTSSGARSRRLLGTLVVAAMMIPAGVSLAVAVEAPPADPTAAATPDHREGLKGEYFTTSAPDWPLNDLRATVVDPDIDFGDLVPTFSELTGRGEQTAARWTGSITATHSEEYTFFATGDNGMRLWVDGDQIIDHWVNDWDIEQTSTPVTLEAGHAYTFRMEMFQATGGANMHLRWASASQAKEVVPSSAFTLPDGFVVFPADGAITADGTGLDVTFGDQVAGTGDLTDHAHLTVDGISWPIDAVEASADTLHATLHAPVSEGARARFVYDGQGDLSVGGESVSELNFPVTNGSTYRITTPWADAFDPENPLPEYPRPQLTRTRWENLNGIWQFTGAADGDAPPIGQDLTEQIVVPYGVESQLSGIERHEDRMFYRRTFTVPASWRIGRGQQLRLNFGAVDYAATVWVNGVEVGTHEGGFTSFSMDVTAALTGSGVQEVVVGVTDTTDGRNQAVGKQTGNPSGIFYTATSGIWQTVWMEPVPTAAIDSLVTTPDIIAGVVSVTAQSASASDSATVTAVARDARGKKVGQVTGQANTALTLRVPNPHLWSPDDPYLYDVDVTLRDHGASDEVGSYVGMRSIEVASVDGVNRILLNGEKTFLLSTLDQGFWPDGLYTPASDEAYVFDLQAHKDLGFNTVRKHIKVEPARWYYHADQLGLMVWQDIPSGWFADAGVTDEARATWEAQLHQIVDQHASVPSIIGWVTFNEGWGQWSLDDTTRIIDDVKAQDPGRLVNGHSGVNCCASLGDTGNGDVIDWHQYTGPAAPKPDDTRASIDGEHGGFSLSVLGHTWPGGSVNPYGEVADSAALTTAYVQNTEKMVRPAQCYLSGSVYTEISDVEGELNGFYTYDRKVLKMDEDAVREVNERVIAAASRDASDIDPGTPGLTGTHWWTLDEGEGSTAADSVGDATVTATGAPTWVAGRDAEAGTAVHLDGNADFLATDGPAVDTENSYSISAWVSLDRVPGNWATIVGQDSGTGTSAFFLQYGHQDGAGVFAFSYDGEPRATYQIDPVAGEWYHLVGVRDAAAQTLTLYVNGVEVGTSSVCGGTTPSGPLTIGRGQYNGGSVDFWPGTIDEVRTFDRALSGDEVLAVMAGEGGDVDQPQPDAWDATVVYDVGDHVTYDGRLFLASWWTQNQVPGASPWGPWQEIAPADATGVARWTASRIYEAGDRASLDGTVYEAKWPTRNQAPSGSLIGPWRVVAG